jgi:uncharacterized protein YacL
MYTLVRTLSDQQLEVFKQISTSQNFLLILVGAAIWFLGFFMGIIAPFFTVPGFALTIIATAQAAMSRPVSSVLPGLLIGGLIQIIGYYILLIPVVGWFIGPVIIVFGGVLLLFYAFSVALQRIDIPVVKNLEDFLESQQKKKDEPKAEPEDVTTEVVPEKPSEEETDSTEQ